MPAGPSSVLKPSASGTAAAAAPNNNTPTAAEKEKALTPSGFADILQSIQSNKNLEQNFALYEYAKQNSPEITQSFAPHIQYYDALRKGIQHRISATGYEIPKDEYAVWQQVPKDVQEKLKAGVKPGTVYYWNGEADVGEPGYVTDPIKGENGVTYKATVDGQGNITGYTSDALTHVAEATRATGRYAANGMPNPNVYVQRSSGFLSGMIGDFGDMLKSMGPFPAIVGNMILPGAGSALAAVLALDEGNEKGAILSGLNAGAQMGANAASNALSAEVSGNVDLANQYSSGIQGALAQNAGNLKTASDVAQLANAIDQKNISGALTAAGNLTGATPSPEIKTGMAVVGLAKALSSGDTATAVDLAGQLTGNQDAKVAAQAIKTLNALNSGNIALAMTEGINLGKAADPYLKQAKADVLKNTNTASMLADGEIDPSQFDAAELLFGTNAGSLGEASDLDGLQETGTGSNQMTQEDLVNIINNGLGDATLTGGTGADTLVGGQDSVMGGEATTQGGTSTDTTRASDPDSSTANPNDLSANTGTTIKDDDGNTLTVKPDGTTTITESTSTGGSQDTGTGGSDTAVNVGGTEYHADGTYTVTHSDGTKTTYNADGTEYSITEDSGDTKVTVFQDETSPSGYRDSLGNPVNQDGTPYVATNTGNTTILDPNEPKCADGWTWNGSMCIADDDNPDQSTNCPDGYILDVTTQACVKVGTNTTGTGTTTTPGGNSPTTTTGGQSTLPGGQSTVGGGGIDLFSLLGLFGALGGGAQPQQNTTPPPVADIKYYYDFGDPFNPKRGKKDQPEQFEFYDGGEVNSFSVDDLIEILKKD
jgi:hypothetical protein